jgi:hypothetical protein
MSLGVAIMVTKTYILQEIKRTAEANGGMPLGWKRFESETGIKRADWYGKHFARWGDAIHEAGYTPNQLQSSYEDTYILDKYIQLARELRKLPVNGDIRLKARSDPEFPCHSTFRKLGTKSELIERLLKYCQNKEEYEDVVLMCKEFVPHKQEVADESSHIEINFGFVYLIKSGRYYKIGKANDADYRVGAIRLQLPEKAKRIHTIKTDNPRGIEAYWHTRFDAKRKNGEWFELNATDIAAFKRRKFM